MALLSSLASHRKAAFHDPKEATYLIMAIVNYTNVCVARCDYCSFYRLPHQAGTYLLNFDQVCAKIDELIAYGGQLVGFNGGFHPDLRIQDYADLFQRIRGRYGRELEFYEMTVAEFMFSCKLSKLPYPAGAEILREAGVKFVSGGGAEILDDAFRMRHSPGKFKVHDYFDAQRAIINAGLGSTATMVIGFDETLNERFNHLESLRHFQDSVANALVSFLCWTYKPQHNRLGGEEISTEEYLRWLAICRIYLDNIPNIRTSVLTKNAEALRALNFGANDFDLPTEDEVTQQAGATISLDFAKLLQEAELMGFRVIKRKPYPIRLGVAPHSTQDLPRSSETENSEAVLSPSAINQKPTTVWAAEKR
jgi:cyclic dehypoxanthinyl futalosine synthase